MISPNWPRSTNNLRGTTVDFRFLFVMIGEQTANLRSG